MECTNLRGSNRVVAKSARKAEGDVSSLVIAVSKETTIAAKRRVAIIGMKLTHTLKRVTFWIHMKSQAAIFCILAELECDDSDALRTIVACRVVLHNRVMEVYRALPDTDSLIKKF